MIRDNLKKEISPLLGFCILCYLLFPFFITISFYFHILVFWRFYNCKIYFFLLTTMHLPMSAPFSYL
ncbi:hypothetical protein CFP56_040342 [Quercus suber]|uniref:Uncharacterized protein n=1 Tax=Quercus suber TaxID=58331 RepID=A0AAW0LMF3_QUESU